VGRLDPFGEAWLQEHGIVLLDGQALMETARLVKSPGELILIGESLRTAEIRSGIGARGAAPGRRASCASRSGGSSRRVAGLACETEESWNGDAVRANARRCSQCSTVLCTDQPTFAA